MLKRVPALRFPEFLEGKEWQEKQLYSVCQMKAGKFISASKINTQYIEGLYPCYGGNGLRGFTSEYSHSGEYSLIGRQGALCGNVNFVTGRFYATEHAIVVSPNKKINNNWLFYCLNKLNLNQYAIGQAQPGLSVNFLEKITIQIPEQEKEQQKIADCLSSLDNIISLQTQKIDALQQYKQGLMQKLFPAEGETVPELRFSEFLNDPEWKLYNFCNLIEQIIDFRGRTPLKLGMEWGNGNIISLSANNVKNGYIDYNAECNLGSEDLYHKWMGKVNLEKGDIVFTMEAPLGNALLIPDERKYILSQRVVAFKTRKKINNKFFIQLIWGQHFQNTIRILSTGSTAKGINQKSLNKIYVRVPSLDEQVKISKCFSSLDDLITAETQKLVALKTHKAGLMQQLFPAMDEVNA